MHQHIYHYKRQTINVATLSAPNHHPIHTNFSSCEHYTFPITDKTTARKTHRTSFLPPFPPPKNILSNESPFFSSFLRSSGQNQACGEDRNRDELFPLSRSLGLPLAKLREHDITQEEQRSEQAGLPRLIRIPLSRVITASNSKSPTYPGGEEKDTWTAMTTNPAHQPEAKRELCFIEDSASDGDLSKYSFQSEWSSVCFLS